MESGKNKAKRSFSMDEPYLEDHDDDLLESQLILVAAIVLFLIAFIAIPSGVLLGRTIKRLFT